MPRLSTPLAVGISIFLAGLVIGLPNFQTILIDFTQFGQGAITLMRLGIVAVIFYTLGEAM